MVAGPPVRGPGASAFLAALAEAAGAGAPVDDHGFRDMGLTFSGLVVFWAALFYALCLTERRWAAAIPQSSKVHENNRYWAARNVIGIVHALLVSVLTVPALVLLAFAPDEIRFASSTELGTCHMPQSLLRHGWAWGTLCQGVAFAGLAFVSFTSADVVISLVHGLATLDYVVHHIAFISAGSILRANCMLPYNSSILLAMEVSTPFLNYMLLFRHRGDAYKFAVRVAGVAFVLLFVLFRLVLNTYGAVLLIADRRTAVPASVPQWQVWFLLTAVAAGAAVQFFWFPAIARTFGAGLRELRGGAKGQADGSILNVEGGSPRGGGNGLNAKLLGGH